MSPSWEGEAICASDIGSDSSTNSHGAAAPARATAAAPVATPVTPVAARARYNVWTTGIWNSLPAQMVTTDGAYRNGG